MNYTFAGDRATGIRVSGKRNAKMHSITWIGTGGVAPLLYHPRDIADLSAFLRDSTAKFHVIGAGSNIVVRDGVMNSVVIKLGQGFCDIKCEGSTIVAGCGASLKDLVVFARANAISGFEFCTGIPGTIGGAVSTNIHAYGRDIEFLLQSLLAVNEYGEVLTLSKEEIRGLRGKNVFGNRWIFVEATFVGEKTDLHIVKNTMNELAVMRYASHPVYDKRVIGYIFKSPEGISGDDICTLIEGAGCVGLRRGHAMVSEKHCNFIENTGKATAGDIEDLCIEVKDKVREKMQVDLEWGIEFWGTRIK